MSVTNVTNIVHRYKPKECNLKIIPWPNDAIKLVEEESQTSQSFIFDNNIGTYSINHDEMIKYFGFRNEQEIVKSYKFK